MIAHMSDRLLEGQIKSTKDKLASGKLSEEDKKMADAYLKLLEEESKKRSKK